MTSHSLLEIDTRVYVKYGFWWPPGVKGPSQNGDTRHETNNVHMIKTVIRLENVICWQFIYFFDWWLAVTPSTATGSSLSLSRFIRSRSYNVFKKETQLSLVPASLSGTPFTIHIPWLIWPTFQVLQAIFCSRQSANFGFKQLLDDVWCLVSTFESTPASNYERTIISPWEARSLLPGITIATRQRCQNFGNFYF